MPLSPNHEYSAMVYAEILSAIGARMVELVGPKAALGVFSADAKSVGERDASMLRWALGVSEENAASAAVISYAAAHILGLDANILALGTSFSQVRVGKCIYGSAVLRYKHPLVCALCAEYNAGIANAMHVRFRQDEKLISRGCDFCIGNFETLRPAHGGIPNRTFTEFMIKIMKLLSNKNSLVVSTLSSLFIGLGERASTILGSDAALIPARAAFDAGKYHAHIFSECLGVSGGLEHAASLVSAVRETMGCGVGISFAGGGFTIVTKNCPQRAVCKRGGFLEVACASYTCGLLSQMGDFEVNSQVCSGVCTQEFRICISHVPAGLKP